MMSKEDAQAYKITEENGGLSPLIEKRLYLSGRNPPQNLDLIREKKITHVISFTHRLVIQMEIDQMPDSDPHKVTYQRVAILDHQGERLIDYFDSAHSFVDKALDSGGSCIIHCDAGVSRSATVAISYLMRKNGWTADKAYAFVRSKRPIISPNSGFAQQLVEFQEKLFPGVDPIPFLLFFMRANFGYGDEDTDEEIKAALEEHWNDIEEAHKTLKLKPRKKQITGYWL